MYKVSFFIFVVIDSSKRVLICESYCAEDVDDKGGGLRATLFEELMERDGGGNRCFDTCFAAKCHLSLDSQLLRGAEITLDIGPIVIHALE
jgi:hypothetical protein